MNGAERGIVWFPGHMAKARKKIAEDKKLTDIIIELLDARLPVSSRNPDFEDIFAGKPIITLLTKSDLADSKKTALYISELNKNGRAAIAVDCKTKKNFNRIMPEICIVLKDKLEANKRKGVVRPVRAMVAGITNVGKSTFINSYTGIKKARAEDRPGVTRANQWFNSGKGIDFLDTPGILWHKFEDRETGVKLACAGAIRDEILDVYELSLSLIRLIRADYSQLLDERYKTDTAPEDTDLVVFEKIARKRGFLRSGGEIDEERCAAVLLDEFRAGKIGRITLD